MSALLARWLELREAADHASRSEALTNRIRSVLPSGSVAVLDLGTGTGSNLRYLADRLPSPQRWLLLDRDPVLLAGVLERTAPWALARGLDVHAALSGCSIVGPSFACEVETRQIDLGSLDDARMFAGRHLVTASALLDLVSDSWLQALASRCRAAGAAALFAITYNGEFSCTPAEPEDGLVRRLMNSHQKRDKGLGGPAEGPDATACAERCFRRQGYVVERAASDWVVEATAGREDLQPDVDALQSELIAGWAAAAVEMAPDLAGTIAAWKVRRLEHVEARRSRLIVGHEDLAAWLPS